jgi:hypothetical protein
MLASLLCELSSGKIRFRLIVRPAFIMRIRKKRKIFNQTAAYFSSRTCGRLSLSPSKKYFFSFFRTTTISSKLITKPLAYINTCYLFNKGFFLQRRVKVPNLLFVAESLDSPQAVYSRIFSLKMLPLKLCYVASF